MHRAIAVIVVALIAVGSLAAAPAQARQATPTACVPATHDEATGAALAWYAAISDGDLSRFDDLMTTDTAYASASMNQVDGVEAVRGLYQTALDAFSNLVYAPDQVLAEADYVAVRYTASGNHTGTFRGAEPTGKVISWNGIGIMRLECGRIAETWMEVDQIGRQQQLGQLADSPTGRMLQETNQHDAVVAAATPAADLACPTTDTREAEMVMFAWMEVWNTGDVALLDGMLLDDYDAADPDANGATIREELSTAVTEFRTAVPDLHDQVTLVFADNDLVVANWTATGTMRGEFLGAPPTNGPVTYTGITMLRLDCGRIAEAWSEANLASLYDQMALDWKR